MSQNRSIRVPLAVDAQVRIPMGPVMLPLRGLFLMAAAAPFAALFFYAGFLPVVYRVGISGFILGLAGIMAVPTQQGVWIGTYYLYQLAPRIMPSAVLRGKAQRAVVHDVDGHVRVTHTRGTYATRNPYLARLNNYAGLPTVTWFGPGLFRLNPGGARAILEVTGPAFSISSENYINWSQQMMNWLMTADCPVQFLTIMTHYDAHKSQRAFDRRVEGWARTPLLEMERELAGLVAERSLGLRHYAVFSPGMAGHDGIPHSSKIERVSRASNTPDLEVERVMQSVTRLAPSFGLDVRVPDRDDLVEVLSHTILGAQDAAVGDGLLHMNDQHHIVMTATKLPPNIEAGVIVDAMMRTRSRGVCSLHISPVEPAVARKALHRRTQMYRYAQKQGGSDGIENEVAIQDTAGVLAAIAQRELKPCRIALTMSVSHPEREKAVEAAERLDGILTGYGFDVVTATLPGFLPALALAPGCAPLGRSLQLTSDGVAMRMLPALGTPFSNHAHPLIGINALTGSPAYFSIWTPPNHNMVVVGSSGAGKSVATKTMLIRHLMEGVSAVVIDPDSEYQKVMRAVGGSYFELGNEAINPLAAGVGVAPDTAAGLVLPIISVMGGDEKGVRDGRPIRRLPDEDQGWMHAEIANFYRSWYPEAWRDGGRAAGASWDDRGREEPVLHNLVDFLDHESRSRALTARESERCALITSRLRRYTQGERARVFDRPSTFHVGQKPIAIGLKVFAMSYGADLTPALAVVLTSTLAAIDRREGRMIVVVDEAHRVTCDPDAGEVLGQLVRQARKYGAGVWMCSQRVEDFVSTDLGRTLAATASTKLVLGAEEAAVRDVIEVFKLRPEEAAAINPMAQGRGVLLCGAERTVVNIVPGNAIMGLADTSGMLSAANRRAGQGTPTH
jgi:hypothetical protein